MLRSRYVLGPYQHRVVLAQGDTAVNGPHQGALVDTPGGEDWFLHFQERQPYGRIVHLQPVTWADGRPTIGGPSAEPGAGVAAGWPWWDWRRQPCCCAGRATMAA